MTGGRRRGLGGSEFERLDSGAFDGERYFDVTAEYAKAAPDDVLVRITVADRGPERATIHLLPTLWFRNTWSWGCRHEGCTIKPRVESPEEGIVRAAAPAPRARIGADRAGGRGIAHDRRQRPDREEPRPPPHRTDVA